MTAVVTPTRRPEPVESWLVDPSQMGLVHHLQDAQQRA